MQSLIGLLNHYGYIVLFVSLTIELIAFPLPGEVLMTYCGFLIREQKLNWILSILAASCGVILGVTLSYFIGRSLGAPFFEKYGHYVHMDGKRLDRVSNWFKRYGNKLLVITYFIPGIRHITGYFSGLTKISYKRFAINAYIGAFIWTATFISLGKVLGASWEKYSTIIKKYLIIGCLLTVLLIGIIYIYKKYRHKIHKDTIKLLSNGARIFHSLGKMKAAIAGAAAAFILFLGFVIGLVQDFIAHEFGQFDEIVQYLVMNIFDKDWNYVMNIFKSASDIRTLMMVSVLIAIWILVKGINKIHEIKFLIFLLIGAEFLGGLLRLIFHRLGPVSLSQNVMSQYTFPSSEALMCIVIYGFLSYMVTRHAKKTWFSKITAILSFMISILVAISLIYFNLEYPSDVTAGFVFGGVWLSLNIILLEVYRILPEIRFS